jgi:uncharacterized protein (TIGR03437 family)
MAGDSIVAQTTPLPLTLGGVRVTVNNTAAPLFAVSESHITFQCPALRETGRIEVVVDSETGARTEPVESKFFEATPSLFALDPSGAGQGAVLISGSDELAMPKTTGVRSRPVTNGEYLSIHANGLGRTEEDIPVGTPAPLDRLIRLKNKVRVVIGGVDVEPAFVGLAPGAVGLYQINVAVPNNSQTGPAVPVQIEVTLDDGSIVKSNTVTVAIEARPALE